jgi:LPS O-antigen subunit length determinant protein (WzzB/FepE family)
MKNTTELVLATSKKAKSTKVINVSKNGLSVNAPLEPKKDTIKKAPKQVTYLAEGINGKQFRSAQLDSNKLYKTQIKSPSKAYQLFIEYFAEYTNLINGFNADEIKPSAKFLDENRSESEKLRNTFSPYLYSMMVKRYYAKKQA